MDDLAREAYSILEDSLKDASDLRIASKIGRLLGEMRTTIAFANLLRETMRKVMENEKELIVPENEEASLMFLLTVLESLQDYSRLMKEVYGYVNKHLNKSINLFDDIDKTLRKYCVECGIRKKINIARGLWFMWTKTFLKEIDKFMDEIDIIIDKINKNIKEALGETTERKGLWERIFRI